MFTSRRVGGREAAALGLVDRCVADDDLDRTVDELAAEVVANSAGTNLIVMALIADRGERTRVDALLHERTLPHGTPDDMAERMRRGGR